MIIRVYRAQVQHGMHAEYERLYREQAIPFLKAQPGLISLHVGKPMRNELDEFVIVSVWKDFAALQASTGEKWEEVVFLPGEAELVTEAHLAHFKSV